MFIRRFATLGQLNQQLAKKSKLLSCTKPNSTSIYHNFFNAQSFLQKTIINTSSTPCFSFSTVKKGTKGSQKQVLKLKKEQMKVNQKGEKYFLLYDGQKQGRSFQIVSALFLLLFGLSLVKIYYTESEYRRDEYIILFAVVGSFVVYQRRILKTLKKITLSQRGDKISITTFNALAKGQRMVEAPIEIMTGFSRATRLGGYILTGGGKTSGLEEMKFWFSKQYITDQKAFEYVGQGKVPKIVDQYQTL